MTVKEIAKAVGRDESNVRRWIKKFLTGKMPARNDELTGEIPIRNDDLDDKMSLRNSIKEKAEHSSPERPADYTLEETLLIIEAGMGKNAAGVYRASAANAQMPPESSYTDLLKNIEHLIDTKIQAAMAPVIAQNEQKRLPSPPELPDGDKIRAFAGKYLEITGKGAHFITLDDAFTLYQRETGEGIPRNILSYQLFRAYPVLSEKMRKVEHRMEKVITGCRPQERLTTDGKLFSSDAHYLRMFGD
jgi:hypothetical protein